MCLAKKARVGLDPTMADYSPRRQVPFSVSDGNPFRQPYSYGWDQASSVRISVHSSLARASCSTIRGANNCVRAGARVEVTTSSTSTVLNIFSSNNRTPAASRVL